MYPTYPNLLDMVKSTGNPQYSQHGDTIEYLGLTVYSSPGEMPRRSNINYNIGYMEALQLIAGIYNIQAMIEVAPNASHKLFTLPMAYGPRVANQVPRIIAKLQEAPDTRQAIIFIGKPEDGATNDQPCTTSIQFLLRGNSLHAMVNMRSWDLIKGLPYDLMMFHGLTGAVAHVLGVLPGPVLTHAASGHIYEKDMAREAVVSSGRSFEFNPDLPRDWMEIREYAQRLVLDVKQWEPAQKMRHLVPPIFRETYVSEYSQG